jgi:dynein heavy chain
VKSFKECQKAHPSLEALVKADSFCAGYRNGTSPCDGDSGGGLVFMDTSNKWTIYGIVSAGLVNYFYVSFERN